MRIERERETKRVMGKKQGNRISALREYTNAAASGLTYIPDEFGLNPTTFVCRLLQAQHKKNEISKIGLFFAIRKVKG